MHAGQEPLDQRLRRAGPHQHSLVLAALVEHRIGEDMAPIGIGNELNLIDRDETHLKVAWHGLDGRDPVARMFRLDLLLTRDECHGMNAGTLDKPVIDFAGEKPKGRPMIPIHARACARSRDASCPYWSGRAPP